MPNRLAQETSPYLRQHAENPVDWYPWGEEALARARAEDKPILLSIGYSACHWCHVMAHESFEDPATARVMNRLFVNIKVDREERPDLDHIYQTTHQLLSGASGGWPLTVFLTPEQLPFFSGTYFPPQPRHGLPAFRELLARAERAYREQRDAIAQQGAALREALARFAPAGAPPAALERRPIDEAVAALRAEFDSVHGGFGTAPKFPQPQLLSFLLRHDPEPALATLRNMAVGGVYDQLGGGFYRYSVDARWMIPHFEKMLYDNAALLALTADAYALTHEPLFARIADETVAWALREMRDPRGAFYAALDADSEGHEGRFYVWSREEAAALLTDDEYAVVAQHYGLSKAPNFEGRWHLYVAQPIEAVAARLARPLADVERDLGCARAKLAAARGRRVRPGRDDKILTSWNGLMIGALARAARVFERSDWLAAAHDALDFLRAEVWRDSRLYATWQAGRARHAGYLDDYAFLLAAALESMQAQFRRGDYDFALALADALLARFEDKAHGGFYFTAHDHEPLIHRDQPVADHATPGGNAVAAFALQRLSYLSGDAAHAKAAERCLKRFGHILQQAPHAVPTLLCALHDHLDPPTQVVLRGPGQELPAWQRALAARFLPQTLVFALANDAADPPPGLAHPTGERVAAYVCAGQACLPPILELDALLETVTSNPRSG
jgi:uncharacterized protein YyaL (SSP411 family)